MKAIVTKYLGPSYTRGSRMMAKAEGIRVTLNYQYELHIDANHRAAMQALCKKRGRTGQVTAGTLPSGEIVWVFVDGITNVGTV